LDALAGMSSGRAMMDNRERDCAGTMISRIGLRRGWNELVFRYVTGVFYRIPDCDVRVMKKTWRGDGAEEEKVNSGKSGRRCGKV